MSSKKAMKLAQKQAFAKHRSNITNTKFGSKKINFTNNLIRSVIQIKNLNFHYQKSLLFCKWILLIALLRY